MKSTNMFEEVSKLILARSSWTIMKHKDSRNDVITHYCRRPIIQIDEVILGYSLDGIRISARDLVRKFNSELP